MPQYQYRALDQLRQDVQGEISASSADEALAQIRRRGLFPTSLKEVVQRRKVEPPPTSESASRPGRSYGFGISRKALIRFTYQFAQMQQAGLTILRSLQTLENQQGPGVLRRVIRQMRQDVENGNTLSEAMARHPRVFDDLYIRMVAVGETTGEIENILVSIAAAKEKILRLRRRVIRAMIYPAFVIAFAIAVFLFIALVVLPMIRSALTDMGKTVSGPLGSLLELSGWFFGGMVPGWLKLVAGAGVVWLALRLVRQVETGRYFLDSFKLHIPIFGNIFYKTCVARMGRVLGTLIGSGVPILEALRITRDTAGNQVFSRALEKIRESVREGHELTSCLKDCRLFDPVVINMVEVGEETGDIDKILLKLADNYEEDVDASVGYLASLLEPTLIIIMCLLVGGMIISLFSLVFGALGGG